MIDIAQLAAEHGLPAVLDECERINRLCPVAAVNPSFSPELIARLARALDLAVEDIYAAIAGTLHRLPWERAGELDLKDPELELMFRQLDNMPDGEPKDRVKAFIRFTLEEERRRRRREAETQQ